MAKTTPEKKLTLKKLIGKYKNNNKKNKLLKLLKPPSKNKVDIREINIEEMNQILGLINQKE